MYYIVYGLLWLVSLLPLWFLYLISDAIYGLVFYVFKYRKDVVMANLEIAFPERSMEEKKRIAKEFYHNLIDTFIEAIKMISTPTAKLAKHFTGNTEVVNDLYASGRSVQIHIGHNFNWEWGNAIMVKQTPFKFLAVYMPLTSKLFDRIFYKLRSRDGTILIPATNMREGFLPYRKTQYLMGLAVDQNPGYPGNAWWFNFFGKPTPFVKGPAKAALVNDTIVVFAFIHKRKRGYYELVLSLAEEHPRATSEIDLTRKFVRYLEGVIREHPAMWLWSHRRWKWEWKPEYGDIIE
jgi:KDO2-lipid IV(A) lauroyltransferase